MASQGGRKLHNYWSSGGFTPVKLENARIGALCNECANILKNTTKTRLQAHRRICVSDKTLSNSNDLESSNITLIDTDEYEETEIVDVETSNQQVPCVHIQEDINNIQSQGFEDLEILNEAYSEGIEIAEDSLSSNISTSTSTISSLHPIFIPSSSSRSISPSPCASASTSSTCSSKVASSRKEFTSPSPNPTPKKKLRKIPPLTKISNFIDSMDGTESSKVDLALAKFFYACNIPFAVVESDWFLAFIRLLRPAYKPPSRKNLAERLLDTVYLDMKETFISKTETEGVLLIDGWKNSNNNSHNVLTLMKTINGQKVFVESFDFTNVGETGEELANACEESIKICKEKYNTTIYSVISDNARNMKKMGRLLKAQDSDLMHVTCNSHTANLLAKEIANKKINDEVVKVQRFFKNHSGFEKKIIDYGGKRVRLPVDVRWCTYRNSFENFLLNLNYMKTLAAQDSDKKIATDIKQLLFDDNFIQSVEEEIHIYDPVCKLINKCQDDATIISEAAHLWLQLQLPDKFKHVLSARKEMALSIVAKAAYTLDPRYLGKDLTTAQQNEVTLHFIEIFSTGELNDYDKFVKGEGIFAALNKKLKGDKNGAEGSDILLPRTYWSLASKQHPGLSKYAIRLLCIPASSAAIERVFSQWSFVHTKVRNRLSQEHSKKLIDIHYTLKMIDTNKTDEY